MTRLELLVMEVFIGHVDVSPIRLMDEGVEMLMLILLWPEGELNEKRNEKGCAA